MLTFVNYEQVENSALKGFLNGKHVKFFMVVNVTSSNLLEAVTKLKNAKGVVALNFIGDDYSVLGQEFVSEFGKPILAYYHLPAKSTIDVQQVMIKFPQYVRVVFQVSTDFSDMQFIYEQSKRYPNISFSGGRFIRLGGCKFGGIHLEDIPRKLNIKRLPLTPNLGEDTPMGVVDFEDISEPEFYEYVEAKPKAQKAPKAPKAPKVGKVASTTEKPKAKPKPKKQVSALLNVVPNKGGLDNF